jgi:YQGE family putative transporter
MSSLFYLTVLMMGQSAASYVLILGVILGLASGFFWLAYNVVYFEVTGTDNRDRYKGWDGLLGSGAGMVAPWLSGYVITQMTDMAGYRVIFSVSLGIFAIGAIVSFFLKKREVQAEYDWFHALKQLRQERSGWRPVSLALTAQGVREGVFAFIIGLLVFVTTNSEMQLGNYSFITSAVALISFYIAGKYVKPQMRLKAMLFGILMIIIVILPFFWAFNYTTLLIFGIGTALFMPLYTIPMTSSVFDLIGSDQRSAEQRVEYIVLRELGLNAGRILGTLLFIIVITWNKSPEVLNILLLVIGSSPLLTWWFMRKQFKQVLKRHQAA